MSVLIHGLKMPQEGFVEILIRDDGTVQQTGQSYRIDGTDYYTPYVGEMPTIYNAVPVQPHGDLIDKDALMKILSKVIDINASIEQRNEATDQERRCLWWFEQQIGIAPTIIPADKEVGE